MSNRIFYWKLKIFFLKLQNFLNQTKNSIFGIFKIDDLLCKWRLSRRIWWCGDRSLAPSSSPPPRPRRRAAWLWPLTRPRTCPKSRARWQSSAHARSTSDQSVEPSTSCRFQGDHTTKYLSENIHLILGRLVIWISSRVIWNLKANKTIAHTQKNKIKNLFAKKNHMSGIFLKKPLIFRQIH